MARKSKDAYVLDRDEQGLTVKEREVLALIRDEGMTSVSALGRRFGMTRQRAKQIVDNLIEKGVLQRDEGVFWLRVQPLTTSAAIRKNE